MIAPTTAHLKAAAARFPMPMACAVFFAIFCWIGIHTHDDDWIPPLAFAAFASFFVTLAINLVAERQNWSQIRRDLAYALAIAGISGWSLMIGSKFGIPHWLLGLAAFGSCILAPAFCGASNNALWRFNQRSFVGVGIAFIAALVLWIGCLAIAYALSELFGLKNTDKFVFDSFIFASSLFCPLYTLTFIPKLTEEQDDSDPAFPTAFAFVLSYVALPVLLVYGVLIAFYGIRLGFFGQSPRGSVSWMVMGFATAGIALHFLLYPLRDKGTWLVRWFHRSFYLCLLPLLGLLLWAVSIRLTAYGFTEMRYLALVGGLWAAAIAIWSLLTRHKLNLAVAPATLMALLILTSFGPWGAEGMAYRSQEGRFAALMTRITAASEKLSWDEQRSLSSVLDFFRDRRDRRMPDEMRAETQKDDYSNYNLPKRFMEKRGLTYIPAWHRSEDQSGAVREARYQGQLPRNFSVRDYDYVGYAHFYVNATAHSFPEKAEPPAFSLKLEENELIATTPMGERASLNLLSLASPTDDQPAHLDNQNLTAELNLGDIRLKITSESLLLRKTPEKGWEVTSFSAQILAALPTFSR